MAYGVTDPYKFILIKNNLKLGLGVNRAKNKDLWTKEVRMAGSFEEILGLIDTCRTGKWVRKTNWVVAGSWHKHY